MPSLTDEQKVQIARQDLAFYIGWAGRTDMPHVSEGYMVPQPHHMQMINRLQEIAPIILQQGDWSSFGNERHTAIVAPPGSAKSTILRHFYEWILGNASLGYLGENWANTFHMGHISHSADQAWKTSLAVRNTIDGTDEDSGPVFRLCFPDVKPSAKWAEKGWRVEGCTGIHETFSAYGVDGSISGNRWNFMGMDDLIKPERVLESNVSSADVEAIIYTVENVCMERLVEGGCSALFNTRWFERDPTSWALDQGWRHIRIRALNEDNESFWEARKIFSAANLVAKREANPEGFALQYQGEPAPEGGIKFKTEWMEYTYDELPWKDAEDRLWNFFIVDSWDTAGTQNPRSDETAGWKAAVNMRTWEIYLFNMYHDKLEYPELMDILRGSAVAELAPRFFWIEDKSTGQPAAQTLQREMGTRILAVKPYGEPGQARLEDVINQVKFVMAQGRVLWPSQRFALAYQMGWVGDAKSALLKYPRGHDDIARSFIQLVYETLKLELEGIIDVVPDREQLGWGEPEGERIVM